ncbi:MAG: nucleotidyltransferase domain-containing protein [Anaerolineae bacterium CFX3]|nr:nucleotidyltransferase domain-containing protein [Anaerolineales bacterium]MCC7511132.1 nucleotidyltransferase domain-containing protein [Anaerolineae bacterium]MCE7905867.1 nucleotidyltransferase domain-containing protein [Anaerolineae bacterium CFX3]MCQ3947029.1 nucleotidyltransferase domain-containing protein [Anaerolineae bacterium]MCZ2289577.1 nucleotidyltransferase domain-containing protein [Anaerolineales bacterium]
MTTPSASTVYVPPINKRDRIPQAAIDDVARQIVEKFHPIKVILFGSYAYGTPRRESDVDLLVVMETDIREVQQEILILKNIEHRFGLDILVKTPKTFNERIEAGDSFLKEIVQKGRVLYEQRTC